MGAGAGGGWAEAASASQVRSLVYVFAGTKVHILTQLPAVMPPLALMIAGQIITCVDDRRLNAAGIS
jgi:hypothetical protein